MKPLIAQLVTLLLFLNTYGMSSPPLELLSAKRQAISISGALQRNSVPNSRLVDSLENSVEIVCRLDSSHLPVQVTSRESWKDDLAKLSFWFKLFRNAYSAQSAPETLGVQFRSFSNSFHLLFCDYFLAEARRQQKAVLLLFEPSISCPCTRRMSMRYELLLDSVMTEMNRGIDLIIVDTVFKPELSSEFGVTNVPAIVLLDRGNREVRRWVREEPIGNNVRAAVRPLF